MRKLAFLCVLPLFLFFTACGDDREEIVTEAAEACQCEECECFADGTCICDGGCVCPDQQKKTADDGSETQHDHDGVSPGEGGCAGGSCAPPER